MDPILPRSFFARDPVTVARALLGQRLVRTTHGHTRIAGIIVETEAYLGIPDKASHTYNAHRSSRNQTMWNAPGHAYVYFTYGMHHCVNAVAGNLDKHGNSDPVAVLIRALEPTENLDAMYKNRNRHKGRATRDTDLCSGPAKLCAALNIDRNLDGADLTQPQTLWIERARLRTHTHHKIAVSPRIGIPNAKDWTDKPLRFYLKNNPHVSTFPR